MEILKEDRKRRGNETGQFTYPDPGGPVDLGVMAAGSPRPKQ